MNLTKEEMKWEEVGIQVIYKKKCKDCDGTGENQFLISTSDDTSAKPYAYVSPCSCSRYVYPFPTEKGFIYEVRIEKRAAHPDQK